MESSQGGSKALLSETPAPPGSALLGTDHTMRQIRLFQCDNGLLIQVHVEGTDSLLELTDPGGANDRGGDGLFLEQPGQGDLGTRNAVLVS
jgi:hypothetical protein